MSISAPSAPDAPPPSDLPAARSERILIADDMNTARFVLGHYLRELGYEFETADNGKAALETLERSPIDLILLDISMPVMDGMEVLSHLRNDPRFAQVPVIVISAEGSQQAIPCLQAGAEDYITKPFDRALLEVRIQNCLERLRLERERLRQLEQVSSLTQRLEQTNQELQSVNQELLQMAYSDGLTGLDNRRAGTEMLHKQWSLAHRSGRPLACIALDLDHFKEINDTHGHAGGDAALQAVGAAIRAVIRESDTAYRLGGDEFVVLCPDTNLEGAGRLAERIRQQLQATTVVSGNRQFRVGSSFGVAATPTGSAQELVDEADASLYAAKAAGRGAVASRSESKTLAGSPSSPANGAVALPVQVQIPVPSSSLREPGPPAATLACFTSGLVYLLSGRKLMPPLPDDQPNHALEGPLYESPTPSVSQLPVRRL